MTEVATLALSAERGPHVKGEQAIAPFSDEVSLRASLAKIARAYGWTVREELVVPGWGRIDLVLGQPCDPEAKLVELKLDLNKPAKVRRAFQQADGYGRWWASRQESPCWSLLVGVDVDDQLVRSVGDIYPSVRYMHASVFMSALHQWDGRQERAAVSRRRIDRLRDQIALHAKDLGFLTRRTRGVSP